VITAQKAVTVPVVLLPWTRFRVSWDAETSSAWHFYCWIKV